MKRTTTFLRLLTVMLFVGTVASAQTITVTSSANSGPGTLRQAVMDITAGGTINFDSALNNNLITLTGGIILDKDITITGNGNDVTVLGGNDDSRVIIVTGGNVVLNNIRLTQGFTPDSGGALWITGGNVEINNSYITNSEARGSDSSQGGGGIYVENAQLMLNGSVVSGNAATGAEGSGGGILVGPGSQLTITDSSILNNMANRAGGGIEGNNGSPIVLTEAIIDGNNAGTNPGKGGGLHITGTGDATIIDSYITNNIAAVEGGGIWNGLGDMNITGSFINNNTASGAVVNQGGGGLFNLNGMLQINNTRIKENYANGTLGSGGGILSMGGDVTIVDSEINENSANRAGGGIEIITGIMTINDSEVSFNEAWGVDANPGNGGGLHISDVATVVFNRGKINENMAAREGGGLWNQTGSTMTLNKVTVHGNVAEGASSDDGGGAIFNNGGTLNVNSSTLSGNSCTGLQGRGGAVHINGGTANIMVTTISGNTSAAHAGGIYNNAALTVNANTISLNNATMSGGGIYNNSVSSLSVKNTIVAGNTATISGNDLFSSNGLVNSNGYNLIGMDDTNGFDANNSDHVGTMDSPVNAGLMGLADNGSENFTQAFNCPSAAADMGDPNDNFNDQNDMPVFNGRRDIGAYEAQQVCALSNEEFALSIKSMIYPNPSLTGIFNLQLAERHGSGTTISIYDIATGKLVKNLTADTQNVEVGISDVARGTYVMQIVSDNSTETHKLIVGK